MNKDQAAGATKRVVGKVQANLGKVAGSKTQQFKGTKLQVEGAVQEVFGDIKHAADALMEKK
jgi:uncharacterized protein YjbJ (UPF0337 family)